VTKTTWQIEMFNGNGPQWMIINPRHWTFSSGSARSLASVIERRALVKKAVKRLREKYPTAHISVHRTDVTTTQTVIDDLRRI